MNSSALLAAEDMGMGEVAILRSLSGDGCVDFHPMPEGDLTRAGSL